MICSAGINSQRTVNQRGDIDTIQVVITAAICISGNSDLCSSLVGNHNRDRGVGRYVRGCTADIDGFSSIIYRINRNGQGARYRIQHCIRSAIDGIIVQINSGSPHG